VELYEQMTTVAEKYPSFVIPLARDSRHGEGKCEKAYEFYFMEWGFHGSPLSSVPGEDAPGLPPPADLGGICPQMSTILFTPLQEPTDTVLLTCARREFIPFRMHPASVTTRYRANVIRIAAKFQRP
jgi:hypothetical protein